MAEVLEIRFGKPTLLQKLQVDWEYWQRKDAGSWDRDNEKQAEVSESARIAGEHNVEARATWGTLKDWIEHGLLRS